MFQIMAQTIRIATLRDAYDSIPSAGERAERARRQAEALAATARELQAKAARREAEARAKADLTARARVAEAARAEAARRKCATPLFGRRMRRLSFWAKAA
ncbi:hypothetical protein P2H44_12275 [Albimonas sp. CAU 1670]|uniref:hypothetical protein n=1 Tax=Albimonas sp. CAU 1670 TaxID=3032599 RepID=UPI0023DA890E|nr:hypothetical protein [Albimonas sp. CAU 1670]MDF2233330.1 hypothetical protein [Albimonas sp. CAU 1670]